MMKYLSISFLILLGSSSSILAQGTTLVFAKNATAVKRFLENIASGEATRRIIWYPNLRQFNYCGSDPSKPLQKVPSGYRIGNVPAQCDETPRLKVAFLMEADSLKRILENVPIEEMMYANSTLTVKSESNMQLEIPLNTDAQFAFLKDYADRSPLAVYRPREVASSALQVSNIQFDLNAAEIKSGFYPVLDQLVSALKNSPTAAITLAGHSSSKEGEGTDAYLLRLSKERADAIKTYLVNSGISAQRISVKAYGETRPISSDSTEQGRLLNSRVEIIQPQ